jgi:PAS domain S-box-containing protein
MMSATQLSPKVTATLQNVTPSIPAAPAPLPDGMSAALLEAAPDAMVCIAADGRIVLLNAQAERLFGYERAELIGQRVEILVPDAARAVHPGHRAQYVADPRTRPMGAGMALAGRRRDASTFPVEISLSRQPSETSPPSSG